MTGGLKSLVPAPTTAPQRKVIAATGGAAVGSAVAVILGWILDQALASAGIQAPEPVKAAFNTVFTTLSAFLFGYYTSPGANETTVQMPSGAVVAGKA